MPRYQITSPDGKSFEITAPEGASEQDVMQYAQNSFSSGKLGAIAQGAAQGASFGFGDELMAGLEAAGGYALDKAQVDRALGGEVDKTLKQFYNDALEKNRAQVDIEQQAHPEAYLAGNVLGAVGTGMIGGGTKAGAAIGDWIGSGGLAARVAKGAGVGATSGATYGFGSGEGGLDERLKSAEQGAIYGAIAGGAVPAAISGVKSLVKGGQLAAEGAVARGAQELDETLLAMNQRASNAYRQMRDSGATFTDEGASSIIGNLQSALKEAGPLNKRIHGGVVSVFKDLQKRAKAGELGLEELDQYRQLFGDISGDFTNKAQARVANILRGAIDDTLAEADNALFKTGSKDAVEALRQGRAEFAKARKFEMVADIVRKSEGDANYVKRELTKIVNNPKKLRGFNADEKEALKEAARLSGGEAVLKIAGKFGFDPSRLGSGVGAIFGGTGGALLGGATGAGLVPAAGTAARYGQKLLTRGKTERLLNAIEEGSKGSGGGMNLPTINRSAISGTSVLQNKPDTNLSPMVDIVPDSTNLGNSQIENQKQYASGYTPQDRVEPQPLPQDIMRDEGLRHNSYYDTTGNRTVGYGFNMDSGIARRAWKKAGINTAFEDVYNGRTHITDDEAKALGALSYSIAVNDAHDLYNNLPTLSKPRQEALLNLSYQLGKTSLSKFHAFNAAVQQEKWPEAVRHLLKSKYAMQVPNRAREVARKLLRGEA